MSEKYPTWLTGHVKEWAQKRLPTVTLCSTTGNELLEVWYYGDLLTLNEEPQLYIVPSYFAPELVTARDPESGEEFVIFDGGRHGYDNMFCDEHDPSELEHRPLKRYEIPASKLVLELGYSITYTSIGAAVVEDFYDENVVFLRFCFEKELLKKDPLDRQGRILRMVYLNQDLTKAGKYLFPRLMQKFLVFTDRNGKTSLETMLKRWYTQLEKEYRNHIEG